MSGRASSALLFGLTLLAGCDDRWDQLDAPKLIQLTCQFDKPAETMVLELDTGRGRSAWMNGPVKAEGVLVADVRLYRVTLPPAGATAAQTLTINRYDGSIKRRAAASSRAVPQTGHCTKSKSGSRF